MVIKINYVGDIEQETERSVLMTNTADNVPSISSFLSNNEK